jgi:hypothetical protein
LPRCSLHEITQSERYMTDNPDERGDDENTAYRDVIHRPIDPGRPSRLEPHDKRRNYDPQTGD